MVASEILNYIHQNPLLVLGFIFIISGAVYRGKTGLLLYLAGILAVVQSLGLLDTLISFLSTLPSEISKIISAL